MTPDPSGPPPNPPARPGRRHCLALLLAGAAGGLRAQPVTGGPAVPASQPASAASGAAAVALDERVQQAKLQMLQLQRDLLVIEEELLFPANTQLAVFVSMDVGTLFQLESVQLRVDDALVASHLYTPHEVNALHRGAVQRLHLGHLKSGPHVLTAFFTGQGPHERDYRRGATLRFDKADGARLVELQIRDLQARLQPEFVVKVLS